MGLDKTFQKLKGNLYKPFVFFIPKSIVPKENLHLIEDKKSLQRFFDNIILVKQDGAGYEIKHHAPLFEMLQKETVLGDNIFILLSEKTKQEQQQFDYLLQKYMQELKNYVWISDWLHKNLNETFNENVEDEVQTSFELQYQYFLEHQKEIHKQFYSTNKSQKKKQELKSVDIQPFLEDKFKELSETLIANKEVKAKEEKPLTNDKQDRKPKTSPNPNPKKEKLSIKERRAKIEKDLDAEEFLLTSIFNKKD